MRAFGDGEALVSIYGAVDVMDLQPQEVVTVDTGHVVAYDLSISSSCAARSKAAPSSRRKAARAWYWTSPHPDGRCCSPAIPRRL
ncbi:MAG TPA: AIM24 family protein [Pseudonocardiaceae bacterium]|nr:AIM24 family protein [Pseudonocardiaceae bacterium]